MNSVDTDIPEKMLLCTAAREFSKLVGFTPKKGETRAEMAKRMVDVERARRRLCRAAVKYSLKQISKYTDTFTLLGDDDEPRGSEEV